MYEIIMDGEIDYSRGGQWNKTPEGRKEFRGVILPVGDKDLVRDNSGTYAHCTEKIFTNGNILAVGTRIYDPDTENIYTITQELGHDSLSAIKRYLVECVERAGIQ